MTVAKRFERFHDNICLTQAQHQAGAERRERVIAALNAHYWKSSSNTAHSSFVGSRGKHTSVRPPRDVDVLFEMPKDVYDRFQSRSGNKQSQLLQEVKDVLLRQFPSTNIKGDGQIGL